MGSKMTKDAFRETVHNDMTWLSKQGDSLEKRHIEDILMSCVDKYYPTSTKDLVINAVLVRAYQHLQDSSSAYDKGCDEIRKLLGSTGGDVRAEKFERLAYEVANGNSNQASVIALAKELVA